MRKSKSRGDISACWLKENIISYFRILDLIRFLIEKHMRSYQAHIADAILGVESISMSRLYGWESEIWHTLSENQNLSRTSEEFMKSPSYGDGGMASAVRIASFYEVV